MSRRGDWAAHAPYWLLLAGAAGLAAALGGPASLGRIRDLLPDAALTGLLALAFATLWLGYLGVALQRRRPPLLVVGVYGALLLAIFFATPASLSIDLLDYIRRGRILSVYGANPHLTVAASFPQDAFHSDVGWTFLATPYGPAFTLLSAALTRLAGDGSLANVLAFKLASTAAFLLCFALVRRVGGGVGPALLYAFNPFVLLEVLANGHNDVYPAAAVLASLACTKDRRPIAAAVFLALATWFKAPFAVLFPVWLRYSLFEEGRSPGERRRGVALGLAAAALVTLVLWIPFFESTSVFHVYRLHAGLQTKWSMPALLGGALAGAGVEGAGVVAQAVCAVLAVLLVAPAVTRARCWEGYVRAVCLVVLIVPLLGMSWLLPWYFVWSLSLLPLLRGGKATPTILALTAGGLAHYIQQSYLGFDSSYAENLLLGVTSIAPVFLALIWSAARRRCSASTDS